MALFLTGEAAERIQSEMGRYDLAKRERAVCWLYIHGITRRQIAERLSMSEETVKRHLATIASKCGYDFVPGYGPNPVRLLRLFCGLAPHVPLVAA